MAEQSFIQILIAGVGAGLLPNKTQEARDWYREQGRKEKRRTYSQLKSEFRDSINGRKRFTQDYVIGNMYFFGYDPKHKKTLPYYDILPLVFPIGEAKGGFLGINFHYLPLPERAQLMDALYGLRNNSRYDETTKLRISYNILKSATKFKNFRPCIKHYLTDHIRSMSLIKVEPSEWDTALFLPVGSFKKSSARKVWQESRKMIRNL